MTEERHFSFEELIKAAAHAIARMGEILGDPASDPSRLVLLLRELGWNVPYDTTVSGTNLPLVSASSTLSNIITGNNIDFISLLQSMQEVIDSRSSLVQDLGLGVGNDLVQAMEGEFPRQLLDYAVIRFFQDEFPAVYGVLSAVGLIVQEYSKPDNSNRLGYIKRVIKWDLLTNTIAQPGRFFEYAYGWGTPNFNGAMLLDGIEAMLLELGLEVGRARLPRAGSNFASAAAEPLQIQIIDRDDLEIGLVALSLVIETA